MNNQQNLIDSINHFIQVILELIYIACQIIHLLGRKNPRS